MTRPNPTQVRIGMQAEFWGHSYRAIGRAALGVTEAGSRYYWNEYYLESSEGDIATLVFEETETGSAWRWFTMFAPLTPVTAAQAGGYGVDDLVTMNGEPFRVTRVDKSCIYFTEGKTPDGVVVGNRANYFNANNGRELLVVSWTGEEMEYYHGHNLEAGSVAAAFNLSGLSRGLFTLTNGRKLWNPVILWPALLILCLCLIPVGLVVDLTHSSRSAAVTMVAAPKTQLEAGSGGDLEGVHYRIEGWDLVEIGEVGVRFQRHEYHMVDENGQAALLIQNPPSEDAPWLLCTEFSPATPLAPVFAGGVRRGDLVFHENHPAIVQELFRHTILKSNFGAPMRPDTVFYGFTARETTNLLIVRWSGSNVVNYIVRALPEKIVLSAMKVDVSSK